VEPVTVADEPSVAPLPYVRVALLLVRAMLLKPRTTSTIGCLLVCRVPDRGHATGEGVPDAASPTGLTTK
jgi:hypothetical protein